MLCDERGDRILVDLVRAERFHLDLYGPCDAYRIRHVQSARVCKSRRDYVLARITRHIARAAIHFRTVLAGESSAPVRAVSAVCIHDYLAPRKSAVTVRTADYEPSGRIYQKPSLASQHMRRERGAYHVLLYIASEPLNIDVCGVLRRYDDRIDPYGSAVLVDDRDLRLAVGAQIAQLSALANGGEPCGQRVSVSYRSGHQLRSFVAGKSEYHALIARAYEVVTVALSALALGALIHAHRDVGRLTVHPDLNGAGIAVKALFLAVVADIQHRLAHYPLVVYVCRRSDLARKKRKPGIAAGLQSHPAVRILCERRVEHAVGYLVADLIGMPLGHAFAGK